jgi:uncharacterized phage protein (TIGR02218 family)
MKFPTVTHAGQTVGLLLLEPDWGAPPRITHRYDTLIGEGRTSREERRPERAGLQLSSLRWRLLLQGSEADDWRKGLAALGNLPVAVPLWVDALPVADWGSRIYEPQKVLNFDRDTGAYAIYDAASLPGSPAHPLYAPLVLCRWKKRPPAVALSADRAEVEIELAELRAWEWRIGIHTYGAGWTAEPAWRSSPTEVSLHGLELLELNPQAPPALDRVNSQARWQQEGDFVFASRLDIRQALSWFAAMRGAHDSWSPVPAWLQPGPPGDGTPASYVARFASDELALTYVSGATATARIGFLQATSGSQPLPAEKHLYRLRYLHDTSNPELYTDWNAPLTLPEGTYLPAQIAHREIVRSLRPQDEQAELEIAHQPGSLLADWLLGRLFGLVTLTIWRCDPADPAGSRGAPLFEGHVKAVTPAGNTLRVTATLFGTLLERRVPGWVFGPRCNTWVFSPRCGLDEASHRSTGTISPGSLSDDGRTLTVSGVSGWGAPAPANWFAAGIIRTGTGRATQIATIVESTAASGGSLTLKLNRPFWADLISGGQTVQLVPGCDGQAGTCTNKFSNYLNFRGHPFIPNYLSTREVSRPKVGK